MEELVAILINLIANMMKQRGQQSVQKNRIAPPPLPAQRATKAVRSIPSNRAIVTTNMPTAARKVLGRRTKLPSVAMARPIVTSQPHPSVVAPVTPMQTVQAKAIAPASKTTKVPLTAEPIRKWLNPATLQQQFLLTEIFQPPLALREYHLK